MSHQGSAPTWDAAFETLALQHFAAVYHLAVSYTRNPDDAQDLVQDTYLRAYRFWYRFTPGSNMRAWLYTILRNTFINTYHKDRKETRQHGEALSDDVWEEGERAPLWAPAWHDFASLEERLRHSVQDDVKRALDTLPTEYRRVVLLADLEERSYHDIATLVGCPLGTVMSRLFRGRQQLRQRLHTFARQSGYLRTQRPAAEEKQEQVSCQTCA
jgi:RNA polymerase sigma-70 factor (ECF subfamily)